MSCFIFLNQHLWCDLRKPVTCRKRWNCKTKEINNIILMFFFLFHTLWTSITFDTRVIPCQFNQWSPGDPLRFSWNFVKMLYHGQNEHLQKRKFILHTVFELCPLKVCSKSLFLAIPSCKNAHLWFFPTSNAYILIMAMSTELKICLLPNILPQNWNLVSK